MMTKSTKISKFSLSLVVLLAASFWVMMPGAQASGDAFERAHRALSAWQIDEAREAVAEVVERSPEAAQTRYLQARMAHYSGDYDEAVAHIDAALEQSARGDWQQYRDIIASTRDVTANYVSHVSPSGRFEIFVEPGRDEVLIPYAFEALEAAYEVMGVELGHRPTERIRVEVYPRTSVLADVSLLTDENIRTSGTIALCQYNRLMITSPRAVLRGYGWVDTLVHEYVHYVINQRTTQNVPIWMHEGLAKFLERQWRGPDASRLEASAEHLLRRRLEEDTLIPFEDMHPSMALLPSQEDAAVAFAEVYTTMEYLRREVGQGAFSQMLDEINDGHDAQTAFARVLGTSWQQFEQHDWPAYLRQRPTPDFDGEDEPYEERLVFDDEAASQGNELDQVEVPEARDHIQLGQMMQARNRYGAAVVQYRKAARLIGDQNPVLQTRLAQSLINSGAAEDAIEALEVVRELFPSYVSTWLELGRAYMANGDYEEAREALREAARINPFNPEIHANLARVYQQLGQADLAEQAREFGQMVR